MKLSAFVFTLFFAMLEHALALEAPQPSLVPSALAASLNRSFPNAQAVVRSSVIPGWKIGFVPQGLVRYGDDLLLSGYIAAERKRCRVYRISATTLAPVESYDIPLHCSHAGGITVSPEGLIVVADSKKLIVWRPKNGMISPTLGPYEVKLEGRLRGTFITADSQGLVLGTFYDDKDATTAQFFPWRVIQQSSISPSEMTSAVNLLPRTQGVGIAPNGDYWTSSQGKPNLLSYINRDGMVQQSAPFLRGLQGVVVSESGTLWTVSESGSLPYSNRADIYPCIMEIAIGRLVGEDYLDAPIDPKH